MKKPIFLLLLLLFTALIVKKAKAQSYSYKGLYVYSLNTILGDATAEDILLRYCRDSAFNSITIGIGSFDVQTNVTPRTQLAAFIKKAKTRYGVKYFSALVYDYLTLINEVHYYQSTRTDTLEKFDYYNFEYEYWNSSKWNGASTEYCTAYLQPAGYTCDSVGAWNYYTKMMTRTDSLASADGAKTACYIGLLSKNPTKNLYVANTCDLILLAAYHHAPTSLYMSGTEGRLKDFSNTSKSKIDVAPIFASATKDTFNLRRWLRIPSVGRHSEASAMPWYQSEFNAAVGTWKSKVNLSGWQWYQYASMPKDSTSTSLNLVPTNLSATPSANSAVLNWTAVSGASGYRIWYARSNTYNYVTASSNNNSISINGLSASTAYHYLVYAVISDKTSGSSGISTFTTGNSTTPCAVPSGLTAGSLSDVSANLSWTAVSGSSSYNIQYRAVGSASWISASSSTTGKSILGLTPSTNYEFQIQSNCGSGNISAFSVSAMFSTTATPCAVPTGISTNSNSPYDVTINFNPIPGALKYTVEYKIQGAANWLTASGANNSIYISNLLHSSTYQYRVQSDCGAGNVSSFSQISTFITSIPVCNAPVGLTAINITSNSATLDWASVSGASNYNLQYHVFGSSSWISLNVGSASSYSLNSLLASTTYEFKVQTLCQTGISSSFSAVFQFSTDIPPCLAPTALTVSNTTQNSAELNWNAFSGAIAYTVQYKAQLSSSWITAISNGTLFQANNLQPNTAYEFKVESTCSTNNTSGFTMPITATTLPLPCLAPSGINANSVTSNSANITWVSLSNAIDYNISYRLSGASQWIVIPASSNSYQLTNLNSSATYEVQIQSNCVNGGSPYSAISTFSTANPLCQIPVNVTTSSIGQNVALLSWDSVANASSFLLEYRVQGTSIWTSVTTPFPHENLSGLLPSSNYEFHIQSICSVSNASAFSNTTTFSTLSPPCDPPSNTVVNSVSSNSASIGWSNFIYATQYNLRYKSSNSLTWNTISVASNSVNLLGLLSAMQYECQFQSVCTSGNGSFSNSVVFNTAANTTPVCDTVNGLFVSSIKSTSAKLNWNATNNASSYKIEYKKTDAALWTIKSTAFTNKSITSLSPNTNYEFKVQANCSNGQGSFSPAFVFRTSESLSSIKVAGSYVAKAMHSEQGITLQWSAKNEQDLAFYSIERSEDNLEYEPIRNVTAAGNSSMQQDYEFNDLDMKLSAVYGSVWYRLSMTDIKGNITYLKVVEIKKISEFEDLFKVYPNPTTDDNINISVKLVQNEELLVVLLDILGNRIYSKVIVTDDNGFAASAFNPGHDLKPGIYEVIGYSSKRQMSKKIIIY